MPPHALLVGLPEPDARALAAALRARGLGAAGRCDVASAVARACGGARPPDVVVLDLAAPGAASPGLVTGLRAAAGARTVVAVVGDGPDAPAMRLRALDAGADAVVTRPCDWREVAARARAALRRAPPTARVTAAACGDVVVDPASRSVWRAGREVRVTAKEFRLLHALLAEPGRVVPKAELLRRVWGYADGTATRTLTVHVSTLRRKLAAAAATADASIVTVGRSGYAFRA